MAVAMKTQSLPFSFVLIILLVLLPNLSSAQYQIGDDNSVSISVELIHRDSPKSPLYSPSQSYWKSLTNALHRSNSRSKNIVQSKLLSGEGEYFMNISMGTPPVSILGIADTGGDLIWTQCQPCKSCFNQKGPLFEPSKSSTYKVLSCKSQECQALKDVSCSSNSSCNYFYSYGDGSYTNGDLALETFTLPSTTSNPIAFPRTIFGCGFNNSGVFSGIESGIIGLGSGNYSLVSQMGSSINQIFSYCLVLLGNNLSSKMTFGGKGMFGSPGVVSTPMLLSNGSETFYYLTLEGISVRENRVDFYSTNSNSKKDGFEGNIIIDSGTLLTFLPTNLYNLFESEMRRALIGEKKKLIKDPKKISGLCYKTKSSNEEIDVPKTIFHFKDGDLELKGLNIFTGFKDHACFAFLPTDDLPIFGDIAQMNFLVEYNIKQRVVSFKQTDCTTTR